jgi:hypothetical protein
MKRENAKEAFGMEDWEVIDCYTRQQAIADGVLVDVTVTAKEAGFRCPVALSHAVWCECVAVPAGVEGQDEVGRLWDVLTMLRFAILRRPAVSVQPVHRRELAFSLHVRKDNHDGEPPVVRLKAVSGPDDDGGICLTVLLPEED